MDGEEVMKVAEVWYNNWNSLFPIICTRDDLASAGVYNLEDGEAKAFFLNTPDGSEATVPGQPLPFHLDKHPVEKRSSRQEVRRMMRSISCPPSTGQNIYMRYIPSS